VCHILKNQLVFICKPDNNKSIIGNPHRIVQHPRHYDYPHHNYPSSSIIITTIRIELYHYKPLRIPLPPPTTTASTATNNNKNNNNKTTKTITTLDYYHITTQYYHHYHHNQHQHQIHQHHYHNHHRLSIIITYIEGFVKTCETKCNS